MVSIEEVQEIVSRLRTKLAERKSRLDAVCYCESNASDLKGPCNYCMTYEDTIRRLAEGESLIQAEPMIFLASAEAFVDRARPML